MVELLLSLLIAATGIAWNVSPELTAIAQRRATEIQPNFAHADLGPDTVEVLHYNRQPLDASTPRAAAAWQESASHWATLTDTRLTHIGCAVAQGVDITYFVCVLARMPPTSEAAQSIPLHLPDTATLLHEFQGTP